jgi:hypothetical protein
LIESTLKTDDTDTDQIIMICNLQSFMPLVTHIRGLHSVRSSVWWVQGEYKITLPLA